LYVGHFELIKPCRKLPLNGRKAEKSNFLRQKNAEEIIINHKGTTVVKDGDTHGLTENQLETFRLKFSGREALR